MNTIKRILTTLGTTLIASNMVLNAMPISAESLTDKGITYLNLLELKKATLGIIPTDSELITLSDMNNDYTLNILDVIAMKEYLLNRNAKTYVQPEVDENGNKTFTYKYSIENSENYVFGTLYTQDNDSIYSIQSNLDETFRDRLSIYCGNDSSNYGNFIQYEYLDANTPDGSLKAEDTFIFTIQHSRDFKECVSEANIELGKIFTTYSNNTLEVSLDDLNLDLMLLSDGVKYQENTLGNIDVVDIDGSTNPVGAMVTFSDTLGVKSLVGAFGNNIFSNDGVDTYQYHDNTFKISYDDTTKEYRLVLDGNEIISKRGDMENYEFGNYLYSVVSQPFKSELYLCIENKANKDKLMLYFDNNTISEVRLIDTIEIDGQLYSNMVNYIDNQIVSKTFINLDDDSKTLVCNSLLNITDENITYYSATPTTEDVNYYDNTESGYVIMLSKRQTEDCKTVGIALGSYNYNLRANTNTIYSTSIQDDENSAEQTLTIKDTELNNTITTTFDGSSYNVNKYFHYKDYNIFGELFADSVRYTHSTSEDIKNLVIE
ncbi:MAG: hypothetical protein ACI4WH_05205 [Oscillospiraceae bacterium]